MRRQDDCDKDKDQDGGCRDCSQRDACEHYGKKTTFLEGLEIDRQEEWIGRVSGEAQDFMHNRKDLFSAMVSRWLIENTPDAVPVLSTVEPIQQALIGLVRLMFTTGYCKGMAMAEARESIKSLDKLMGEE